MQTNKNTYTWTFVRQHLFLIFSGIHKHSTSMYDSIEVCLLINKFICCFCLFVCLCDGGSCLRIACSTTLNNNKKEEKKNRPKKSSKFTKFGNACSMLMLIISYVISVNLEHLWRVCVFFPSSSLPSSVQLVFFYYLLLISTCTPKIHKTKLIIQRNSEQITLFSSLHFCFVSISNVKFQNVYTFHNCVSCVCICFFLNDGISSINQNVNQLTEIRCHRIKASKLMMGQHMFQCSTSFDWCWIWMRATEIEIF